MNRIPDKIKRKRVTKMTTTVAHQKIIAPISLLFGKSNSIDKANDQNFLKQGTILSLIWALLEELNSRGKEIKSAKVIQKIIIRRLSIYYAGFEDVIENLKVKAWMRLQDSYKRKDGENSPHSEDCEVENRGDADIINIVESLFHANHAWIEVIDYELVSHFDYLSGNLGDEFLAFPVRSRIAAEEFEVFLEKEVFEFRKAYKQQAKIYTKPTKKGGKHA